MRVDRGHSIRDLLDDCVKSRPRFSAESRFPLGEQTTKRTQELLCFQWPSNLDTVTVDASVGAGRNKAVWIILKSALHSNPFATSAQGAHFQPSLQTVALKAITCQDGPFEPALERKNVF
jgi:hypothetical protein